VHGSHAILGAVPSAPATPDIGIELDRDVLSRLRQLRPHKVVVLDCQCHTFDDVERALCRVIPAMTRPKAHAHAWEIHTSGTSVVATAPREQAEHFGTQLCRHGLRVSVESDT
jgi:ATP-dependent Clp protease adaptor protein ClpS